MMSACSGISPYDPNHIHIRLDKHVTRQKVRIANLELHLPQADRFFSMLRVQLILPFFDNFILLCHKFRHIPSAVDVPPG